MGFSEKHQYYTKAFKDKECGELTYLNYIKDILFNLY